MDVEKEWMVSEIMVRAVKCCEGYVAYHLQRLR